MGNVMSLEEVLQFLVKAGGIGAVLSFLFETAPFLSGWFQPLDPKVKWWIIFGGSVGLPVLAQVVVLNVPPAFLAAIQPYWNAAALGFLAWAGSQGTHNLLHKKPASR